MLMKIDNTTNSDGFLAKKNKTFFLYVTLKKKFKNNFKQNKQ